MNLPGPELVQRVNQITSGEPGDQIIKAMQLSADLTADAKSGKQVSLTAMALVGQKVRENLNKINNNVDGAAQGRPLFNDNGIILETTGSAVNPFSEQYLSDYDFKDSSGQTFTRHIIDDSKNGTKNIQFAREALAILRNAPEAFKGMKNADVQKFVDDYVRSNLSEKMAPKFKGIRWNSMSYPD